VALSFERPGFVRQTASDRPGVAQPVPERDVPAQPWARVSVFALVLFVVFMAGWEAYWRAYAVTPGYRNSDGEWAAQRRRIDNGEGNKTVLLGASRVLFDVQLPVWEKIAGERPIQLAMEGTSPTPVLEDLAADPAFTGRLLVGVAPDVFFAGFAYRGKVVPYYHKQGPSQRSGNWLSMTFLEPYFAFYDPDYALATVVRRQPWPARPGLKSGMRVRKLMMQVSTDRESHMWRKVEVDPDYRALCRRIWAEDFGGPLPGMETPAGKQKMIDGEIAKVVAAIKTLRSRGVQGVFVRPPSSGEYYAFEQEYLPRTETWDLLLQRTGAPGVHFEDYPQLRDYDMPEWSHMSASEANRYTAELAPLVEAEFSRMDRPVIAAAR
jgi:hypothetical protein